ncbi:MAG: DUF2263 domain-containing protein, partial [Gammaproteobacteria bacterium]|nr:DUF2263 domain-containing protein [Gammaproteobacteria bacterium]
LLDEASLAGLGHGFSDPQRVRRRAVLRETLDHFANANPPDKYHHIAQQNVKRWRCRKETSGASRQTVQILSGDWGQAAQRLTREHGATFAVLNMANAYVPGGGYVEGSMAQEENMFRRTDCHFSIDSRSYDERYDCYRPEWTALVSGERGEVFLDIESPRVCVRGPEDLTRTDLGYPWLDDDQIFPFFELRSAAVDLRDGSNFSPAMMSSRISAQLDTLARHEIKHVVLGAFGCGAFGNPAGQVAELYREEIAKRSSKFLVIAFAIFHAGYGSDNYTPFKAVFSDEVVLD